MYRNTIRAFSDHILREKLEKNGTYIILKVYSHVHTAHTLLEVKIMTGYLSVFTTLDQQQWRLSRVGSIRYVYGTFICQAVKYTM